MIDIAIDTRGLESLEDGAIDLHDPMETALSWMHADIAHYPPPPANSRYRRTGNLGRAWTTKITGGGANIVGELGNAVRDRRGRSYGPYVQDEQRQVRVHRLRWQTDKDVVDWNETRIMRMFDEHLGRTFNG